MASATTFFVETEGVKLPDGTVWGAGIKPVYQITGRAEGDWMDVFHIYYHAGNTWNPQCDPLRYREMREFVHNLVRHYDSCGMKLWEANHSEWDKATWKKQVTEEW